MNMHVLNVHKCLTMFDSAQESPYFVLSLALIGFPNWLPLGLSS